MNTIQLNDHLRDLEFAGVIPFDASTYEPFCAQRTVFEPFQINEGFYIDAYGFLTTTLIDHKGEDFVPVREIQRMPMEDPYAFWIPAGTSRTMLRQLRAKERLIEGLNGLRRAQGLGPL